MYGAYPHPKTSLLPSSCWWWLGKAWRFYQPPSSSYQTLRLARPTSPIMSDPSSYRALLITIIIRVRGKPLASWDLEFFEGISSKQSPKLFQIALVGLHMLDWRRWNLDCGSYIADRIWWIMDYGLCHVHGHDHDHDHLRVSQDDVYNGHDLVLWIPVLCCMVIITPSHNLSP